MLVCDSDVVDCVVDDDVLALDDVSDVSAVGEVAVVAAAVVDDVVPLFVPVLVVAAAAVVVDALCPSRHASAPPMESIVATLSAVAALRAPAARGVRRRRTGRWGETVGSSMTVNVRKGGERTLRGA